MASNNYCVEVKVGGANSDKTIRYGFKCSADYSDLLEKLGVTDLSDNPGDTSDVVYGCNKPKPTRVTITYKVSAGENASVTRTVKRFASTVNTASTLVGDQIKIRGNSYEIVSVSDK